MRRLIPTLIAVLSIFVVPVGSSGQSQIRQSAESPIALEISGPRLISPSQDPKFTVTFINRSDVPVALTFVHDGWALSNLEWAVTDRFGRVLPPRTAGSVRGLCLLVGPVPENGITVIQPKENYVYATEEDPTYDFAFPGKGFYKVTLRFRFDPANLASASEVDRVFKSAPQRMKPGPNRTLLYKTPPIDVTSNVWDIYLAD